VVGKKGIEQSLPCGGMDARCLRDHAIQIEGGAIECRELDARCRVFAGSAAGSLIFGSGHGSIADLDQEPAPPLGANKRALEQSAARIQVAAMARAS
jgi:hypothetical protein